MSTVGSGLNATGSGVLPHCDNGVIFRPACILWTARNPLAHRF